MLVPSTPELIVIGLVVVLLFGTKRLPEMGTGMGQAISNFRKTFREGSAIDVTPQQPKAEEGKPTTPGQEGPKS